VPHKVAQHWPQLAHVASCGQCYATLCDTRITPKIHYICLYWWHKHDMLWASTPINKLELC